MGNKNIKKEPKKKKADKKLATPSVLKTVVAQPEVIKKPKKLSPSE